MSFYKEHLKKYPCLQPFVGCQYGKNGKKLLILAESHYLPEGITYQHDAERWYGGRQEELEKHIHEKLYEDREEDGSDEKQEKGKKPLQVTLDWNLLLNSDENDIRTKFNQKEQNLIFGKIFNFLHRYKKPGEELNKLIKEKIGWISTFDIIEEDIRVQFDTKVSHLIYRTIADALYNFNRAYFDQFKGHRAGWEGAMNAVAFYNYFQRPGDGRTKKLNLDNNKRAHDHDRKNAFEFLNGFIDNNNNDLSPDLIVFVSDKAYKSFKEFANISIGEKDDGLYIRGGQTIPVCHLYHTARGGWSKVIQDGRNPATRGYSNSLEKLNRFLEENDYRFE